jgi:hypothetical protein
MMYGWWDGASAPWYGMILGPMMMIAFSRYRHVIGPRGGAQDRPVVAEPARYVERPHAVRAHVAEGHRLDRFVEAPGCHPAIVCRPTAVGEGDTVLDHANAPRGAGLRRAKDQFAGRPSPTPGDYPSRHGAPRMAVKLARLPMVAPLRMRTCRAAASPQTDTRIACRPNFLLAVEVLSCLFRRLVTRACRRSAAIITITPTLPGAK